MRPDLDLTDLRPEGFEPQVTGMDWLPDGRLAISTWGGTDNVAGEVYLLDNVTGETSRDKVTETWQTYDIVFRAARFDENGAKTADARVTVVWNGETVHDDVALDGPTAAGRAETPAAGAIRLQDHGNKVRFRDIRVEPLD